MPAARQGTEPRLSAWVERFLPLAPRSGARVLDLACGLGRHSLYASVLGFRVLAADREPDFGVMSIGIPAIEFRRADLESQPWPFGEEKFAAVIVTNYLHRPLFPRIAGALEEGGLLICETFTAPQAEAFGRPSNPLHWLRSGELLGLVRPLSVVAYEEGRTERGRFVQRICAAKPSPERGAQRFELGAR